MSTTHQSRIEALEREQFAVLVATLLKFKQQIELLTELYDDHNERLEKFESSDNHNERREILELNAASVRANDNRDVSATRPKQAAPLSTAMENTIRLTCQNELAELVVKLCKHDENTQNLAVSLLLEGEGKMCSFTSRDPRGAAGPSKRSRKRRRYSAEESLYSDGEC
jgi:hypothetical protein